MFLCWGFRGTFEASFFFRRRALGNLVLGTLEKNGLTSLVLVLPMGWFVIRCSKSRRTALTIRDFRGLFQY